MSQPQAHPYEDLTPDFLLDAIDATGRHTNGQFLALNSYENRVFQIGLEEAEPIVAKFYRPGRWSDAAILEEHAFSQALADLDIPVIAPLADADGQTLFHAGPTHRFSLYPRRGGHAPELDNPDHLEQLGRFIGRLHACGETTDFEHRPELNIQTFGHEPRQWLLDNNRVPGELREAWASVSADVLGRVEACYERAGSVPLIRLHGDLHPGNILWRDDQIHIVDLDDCRMGPAIQDLWMFLSGDRQFMTARLADVLDGYTRFRDFDPRELHLVEALRSLRMMHHAAWLAMRWDDPAFPQAFPWFADSAYWEQQILALREQLALMDEEPLFWN